jgi:NADH:ubiquinone oxidoreductase subunit 4 (subunit M)
MSLLGEEKNISYGFVGSIGFVELGIPTQLVIHSPATIEYMLSHGLVA